MKTIERIERLARNYSDPNMTPSHGNLHDCLDTLDWYAGICTARVVRQGGAPVKLFGGPYKRTVQVGERIRQHERHAGFVTLPYFWLGQLAEMG